MAGLLGLVLAAGLLSCGHPTETAGRAPAIIPAAAPADVAPAPVTAIDRAAPAVKPTPRVLPVKAKPARTLAAAPPTETPAAPVVEAAAPAPDPAPAPAAPATRTQAGRVLDEAGQPLVGATILLKGSTKGTSTDANGNYSLEVPSGDNTFSIGYGGYEDETASSRDGQPLTVTLLPRPGTKVKGRRGRN